MTGPHPTRGPVVTIFGVPWDAPMLDDPADVRVVPTPVGERCVACAVPIVSGDRGVIMPLISGDGQWQTCAMHTECQMVSTIGHLFGVCVCTYPDRPRRELGLLLLDAVNERRRRGGLRDL